MDKAKYTMRVKLSITSLPATLYGLYIYRKGDDLTTRDIYAIENSLNYYRKKYTHVSFLMGVSNTDSRFCTKRTFIEKGKRGRPVTKVIGKQVERHVHIAVIGNETDSAYEYLEAVKRALNKRFKGKECNYYSKGHGAHAINYIDYILRQSYRPRKKGIFDEILEEENTSKIDY